MLLKLCTQQAGHNDLRHKHPDAGDDQQLAAAQAVHEGYRSKGGHHIDAVDHHRAEQASGGAASDLLEQDWRIEDDGVDALHAEEC